MRVIWGGVHVLLPQASPSAASTCTMAHEPPLRSLCPLHTSLSPDRLPPPLGPGAWAWRHCHQDNGWEIGVASANDNYKKLMSVRRQGAGTHGIAALAAVQCRASSSSRV